MRSAWDCSYTMDGIVAIRKKGTMLCSEVNMLAPKICLSYNSSRSQFLLYQIDRALGHSIHA